MHDMCMACAWHVHVHDHLRKQSCSLRVRSAVTACSRLARACRRLPALRLQSCSDARCCRVNSRVMATSMTWTWLPRWMGGRACGWPPHTVSTTHYVYITTYYITTYYLLPTPYYLQFINVLPASRGDDAAPRLQRVRGIALELPLLAGLGLAPRRSQRLPAPGAPSRTVHFRR